MNAEIRRGPVAVDEAMDLVARHELIVQAVPPALRDVAPHAELIMVSKGHTLMERGDIADGAYVVISGRFVIEVADGEGGLVTVGEAGVGEIIGEMALILDAVRNATVRAMRDSAVLRVRPDDFQRLTTTCPRAALFVAHRLAGLVEAANRQQAHRGSSRVIGVASASAGMDVVAQAERLARALRRHGLRVATASSKIERAPLEALVRAHDIALIAATDDDAGDAAPIGRFADRNLLFVRAGEQRAGQLDHDALRPYDLVIVHPARTDHPTGTARLLSLFHAERHHHVRDGHRPDVDRLAATMAGQPVAVALSGGAARGLVHLGVHRAWVEAGQPIDAVSGTSTGAIVAAFIALGWDPQRVRDTFQHHLGRRSPLDPTVPAVALASGRRITAALQEALGDLDIEDCWLPLCCVATNLTTLQREDARSGRLWRSVRASISLPGIFPPVVEPQGVLVDGGLLDNLPVTPLREVMPRALIVSSLAVGRKDFDVDHSPSTGVVGGTDVARRWLRRRAHVRSPGLIQTLARLTALGTASSRDSHGDLHLEHDVSRWASFDWKAIDELAEVGYRNTRALLAEGVLDRLITSPSVAEHRSDR